MVRFIRAVPIARWMHKANALSLDVVIGAVCGAIFAAHYLNVPINSEWLSLLAIGVWCSYTTDHLLDVLKGNGAFVTVRHRLHAQYFRLLFVLVSLLLLGAVSWVLADKFYEILWVGLSVGALITLYFLLIFTVEHIRGIWIQKEISVAIIYSIGVWGWPAYEAFEQIHLTQLIVFAGYVILVWAAILIIALYEDKDDRQQSTRSLISVLGKQKTIRLIKYLLLSILLGCAGLLVVNHRLNDYILSIIYIAMAGSLYTLQRYPRLFTHNKNYRLWTEYVFFLPALLASIV